MDPATIVERAVELDAPVEAVWAALTEADALADWFGGPVELDPVPGGDGRFVTDEGEVRRARVDAVEPGRLLSWRWWPEGDDDGPISAVTFELSELPAGTRLVVTEMPLLLGTAWASVNALGRGLARLELRSALLCRV
jgi:uncharacterized protein YndB with AHSA1/START domain